MVRRSFAGLVVTARFVMACGGAVSAPAASEVDAAAGDASRASEADAAVPPSPFEGGTFACPSFAAPFEADDRGATACSIDAEFCVTNAARQTHACQPFGAACHSCECILSGLAGPEPTDATVPFTYAAPTPNANGCFGDAATGVTLYLTP